MNIPIAASLYRKGGNPLSKVFLSPSPQPLPLFSFSHPLPLSSFNKQEV